MSNVDTAQERRKVRSMQGKYEQSRAAASNHPAICQQMSIQQSVRECQSVTQTLHTRHHRQLEDCLCVVSVKPRVMTPQSSVNFPKIDLKTAQNSRKQYKKWVMRAVFAVQSHRFHQTPGAAAPSARNDSYLPPATHQTPGAAAPSARNDSYPPPGTPQAADMQCQ